MGKSVLENLIIEIEDRDVTRKVLYLLTFSLVGILVLLEKWKIKKEKVMCRLRRGYDETWTQNMQILTTSKRENDE